MPCELEEEAITRAHSRIISPKVLKAAKEAGGADNGACVVYCLLVNKRWFKQQALLELWNTDLHNVRAVACEVIAKHLCVMLETFKTLGRLTPETVLRAKTILTTCCQMFFSSDMQLW